MKKTTSFQALFRDLPLSLIEEHPLEEEAVSSRTVDRVWQTTSASCRGCHKTVARRRVVWLIPMVAVLTALAVVTGMAFSVYTFTPTYTFPVPAIADGSISPLVSEYEYAVDTDVVSEQGDVRVTLDAYTVDRVSGVMQFLVQMESTGDTVFSELSAERISKLSLTKFLSEGIYDAQNSGELSGWTSFMRVDNGADPHKATFEVSYRHGAENGEELVGRNLVLTMTDLMDLVRVSEDIGFMFASADSLYAALTPAVAEDFTVVGDEVVLPATSQKVSFSAKLESVYIDNVGFSEIDGESYLYISYVGLSEVEDWPLFIDVRNGEAYLDNVCHQPDVMRDPIGTKWEIAKEMGITDGERVTLCYYGITPEMLPHLFMMQDNGYDYVKRAEGTWELPFTTGEDEILPVRRMDVDVDLTFYEYEVHLSSLELSDGAVYFDASYEVMPQPEGATAHASIRGTIDLVMADGTVLKNPFYKDPDADLPTNLPTSGTCRWGGQLEDFIDSDEVVAVIAMGQTISIDNT